MKKSIILKVSLLLLIGAFISCQKDKDTPIVDPLSTGWATVNKNQENWEIRVTAAKRNTVPPLLLFRFANYSSEGFLRGEMHFNNIPIEIGNYIMKEWQYDTGKDTIRTCTFNTMLGDGDLGGDDYIPLNDSSMVFTVDEINSDNKISGRFWGTMIKKIGEMEHDPASPDTLVFSEGKYEVKLE